jgi:hypothetical protein
MEVAPPTTGEPIEWLLLTTVAVHTVTDASERVTWYGVGGALRSGIGL